MNKKISKPIRSSLVFILLFAFCTVCSVSKKRQDNNPGPAPQSNFKFGVNFGDDAKSFTVDQITNAVTIANSNGIKLIKVYDQFTDQLNAPEKWDAFMTACKSKNMQVIMGIQNSQIDAYLNTLNAADAFVATYVDKPYVQNIKSILIGNEISDTQIINQLATTYIPNLINALRKQGLSSKINVSLSIGGDNNFGAYGGVGFCGLNDNLVNAVNALKGIAGGNKQVFINVYPFSVRSSSVILNNSDIYPNSLGCFNNFKQSLVRRVTGNTDVAIGEIGWPSGGALPVCGDHQPITNAAKTNANLNCVMSGYNANTDSTSPFSVIFFELFNENNKSGCAYEKYFGLYTDLTTPGGPTLKSDITLNFSNPSAAQCPPN